MRQTTERLDERALKARTRRSRYPTSKRPICVAARVVRTVGQQRGELVSRIRPSSHAGSGSAASVLRSRAT